MGRWSTRRAGSSAWRSRWAPPARASPAVTVPWARIRERLDEFVPGPRRVFVGWAQQYRCVGRQHAYARAMHPGLPRERRVAQRADRADAAARHRRDRWLMSALTDRSAARLPRWVILSPALVMLLLLLAPAAAVLLTREPDVVADGQAPAGRAPAHRRRRPRARPSGSSAGATPDLALDAGTSSAHPRRARRVRRRCGSRPAQGSVWTANAGDGTSPARPAGARQRAPHQHRRGRRRHRG